MEKDYSSIMLKKKLKFFDILAQALKIPGKSINFFLLSIIASLPFICFLVFFEIFLQRRLLEEIPKFFVQPVMEFHYYYYYDGLLWGNGTLIVDLFFKFFPLFLLYLVPYQLLEFLNIIMIVPIAAIVHTEKKPVISFTDMIMVCKRNFKGSFITSIYVHIISVAILIGFVGFTINLCLMVDSFKIYDCFHILLTMLRGVGFIVLLTELLEWSSGWNMALVISILQEKCESEALKYSTYLSKNVNSSKRGLYLTLGFFLWGLIIRALCFLIFYRWNEEDLTGSFLFTSLYVCLICVGNVMKWAVFVVYFFDCKKQISEKEVDEEVGGVV